MALNIPVTFSGDFLAPDSMQGALSMELFGTVTETKFVTIGDLAYSTDIETGEWVLGAESTLPFDINDFVGSNQIGLITPELVGIEVVDDVWTYHLVGTIPADSLGEDFAGGEDEVTMDYWIGADDFLVRRLTMVLSLISEWIEGSGETEMKISVEIVINDYGKEVVIVSPVD
ncbi:MAG: LppX_LprAFG lipoprotein [Chloroflexota bacterium]